MKSSKNNLILIILLMAVVIMGVFFMVEIPNSSILVRHSDHAEKVDTSSSEEKKTLISNNDDKNLSAESRVSILRKQDSNIEHTDDVSSGKTSSSIKMNSSSLTGESKVKLRVLGNLEVKSLTIQQCKDWALAAYSYRNNLTYDDLRNYQVEFVPSDKSDDNKVHMEIYHTMGSDVSDLVANYSITERDNLEDSKGTIVSTLPEKIIDIR